MTSALEEGYLGPEAYLLGFLLRLKGGLRNEGYAEKTLMVAEPILSSPLVESHVREQAEHIRRMGEGSRPRTLQPSHLGSPWQREHHRGPDLCQAVRRGPDLAEGIRQ